MTREEIKGRATHKESGWSIEWECPEGAWSDGPCSIDFLIFDGPDDSEPLLKGHIKWDGCSNWIEGNGNYFHLCGLRQVSQLHSALTACYNIANQYMPEAK